MPPALAAPLAKSFHVNNQEIPNADRRVLERWHILCYTLNGMPHVCCRTVLLVSVFAMYTRRRTHAHIIRLANIWCMLHAADVTKVLYAMLLLIFGVGNYSQTVF